MNRRRRQVSAWFPVPELGFELLIRYQSPAEMTRLREAALELRRSPQTGEMLERLDPERYAQGLAGVILDWRMLQAGGDAPPGLPREIYAQLIPIEPEDYPELIPCDAEFKAELLLEGRGVITAVLDLCTNLARYRDRQVEAERKN